MEFPSLCLFFGKTNSGKTYYAVNLIYKCLKERKFDYIYILCPSNFKHHSYDFVEQKWRTAEYDSKVIIKLLEDQKRYTESGNTRRLLLILDDCVEYFRDKDPLWERIGSSSRHYDVTTFLFFQHYFACPKFLRMNANYHFHFIPASETICKEYIKEFSLGGKVQNLQQVFDKEVRDYNCLRFDNLKNSSKVSEVFTISRADETPKFVFTCEVKKAKKNDKQNSDSD